MTPNTNSPITIFVVPVPGQNKPKIPDKPNQVEAIPGPLRELLTCSVCFKAFFSVMRLQRHYVKHIVNKPFPCDKCEKSFFSEESFKKHSYLHSEKPFLCEICNVGFVNESVLDLHMYKHSFPDFVCNICFLHFPKKEQLHKHERFHTSIKLDNEPASCYPCPLCDFQYVFRRDLEDHLNNVHERVREFTCKKCDKTFFLSYLLTMHEQYHEQREVCNVCSKFFPNKQSLNDHERTHIQFFLNEKNVLCYVCDVCNVTFPFKNELEEHYETHEGLERYPCEVCDKTFFFSFMYRKHKVSHIETAEFQCHLCMKMLRKKSQFARHIHDTHSDMKRYKCPVCEKRFSTKWSMKQHCIVHAYPKPYFCKFCDTKFTRKENLERHYAVHMTEREFQCNLCLKTFTRKINLRDHLKRHASEATKDANLPCQLCDQTFRSQKTFTHHLKNDHPDDKQTYVCEVCGKVLQTYTSFHLHYRRHSGMLPYKCKFCDKEFNQKAHLIRHHKFNHKDFCLEIDLPFQCAYCPQAYIKKGGLVLHHKRHHSSLEFKKE